jgi:hypothetical protein
VSDFLTNLALRAAGVLSVASPEIPAAPWSEPAEAGLEVKESVEEEPTPRSPATESREDGRRPDPRQPSPGERADVRPPSEIRGGPQKAEVPLRPAPAAPERIREVQTEHHEIVREAAPAPTIEVHETIREKEIVRETLVQRELNVEAPPPPAKIDARPTAVPNTPRGVYVEPLSSDIVREVSMQVPAPPPPTLAPALPGEIAPTSRRTEGVTALKPQPPPPGEDWKTVPRPLENTVPPARVTPPPAPATPKRPLSEFHVPVKTAPAEPLLPRTGPPVVTPDEPVLRPAPLPDAPAALSADRTTVPAREKAVEVTIGSIEIRTAAPSPQPKPPEPAPSNEPLEGFDAYRSVRRYSAWFRE